MLLVNPSELLLLAALPKSAFPVLGTPQPCTHTPCSAGWGWRQGLSRPGVGFASPYLKHQGRVLSTAVHTTPWGPIVPTSPSRQGSGMGSWEGTAGQYGWHCAVPDPWGPPRCCGHPPAPFAPHPRAGVPPCWHSWGRQGARAELRDAQGALGAGPGEARMLSVFPSSPPPNTT